MAWALTLVPPPSWGLGHLGYSGKTRLVVVILELAVDDEMGAAIGS